MILPEGKPLTELYLYVCVINYTIIVDKLNKPTVQNLIKSP